MLPIRHPPAIPDDDTVITDQTEDRDRSAVLSIAAIAAIFVAYLLGLTVLTDTDMASRFENGVAPPGTDLARIRTAALASILAALGSCAAAVASRMLSLVTLGLAF